MKVKITGFWEDDESLLHQFRQYGWGRAAWKDMELVLHDSYDVLVILTRPRSGYPAYDGRKAITLLTEPPATALPVTHPTSAVIPMYLPLPFWQHFHARDWMHLHEPAIDKTELLSSVTSELNYLEGHKARRQLVSLLDKRIDEGFDCWGKTYENDFLQHLRAYRGELVNKYDALWPYPYHVACENTFADDYFTEKIVDPVIAECLCFYDGCLNVEAYIDERSFIRIDVFDPLASIEKIIRSIESREWDKRIPYIRQQKKRLITRLNPLNIVWLAVNGRDVQQECRL